MSVLFPKVNKAPKWEWRPIYYDPKKDEMEEKLHALQAKRAAEERENARQNGEAAPDAGSSYTPTLHRGSFREARSEAGDMRRKGTLLSKSVFLIAFLLLLVIVIYLFL